jgi:carbonic anhydrase/acetyltransferase-like protein (isoleucine patch superfamily)
MSKKYELTDESIEYCGHKLYRIKALRSFSNVTKGSLGGFIEKESNLSHGDKCWVYDIAKVFGNALIYDNARVYNTARVYDSARVSGSAGVYDSAHVYGKAQVFGNARVYGSAEVYVNARVYGNVCVFDNVQISGSASVGNYTQVSDNSKISGNCILKFDYRTWTKDITLDRGIWTNSYIADNKKYIISNTLEQLYIGDVE